MIELELPWPARELSPNARVHHMVKARATKAHREQAYWLVMAKPNREIAAIHFGCRPLTEADLSGDYVLSRELRGEPEPQITLSLTFHPPDKRRRDLDGMFSSVKAALDGIADALGVNDHRFEFHLKRAEPVKNGSVVILIGESQ